MKLPRRQFLHLAAGAAALPALSCFVSAQAYPSRPVRLLVGFSAGGTTDIAARLIAQWLTERLGQPIVVENRPGASANFAAEAVVRSPPDGYTLLAVTSSNTVNATFFDKLSFSIVRDIAMVAGVVRSPLVLEVHPSVAANSVPELIALAKANPGKITLASFGTGSTSHVAGELFKLTAGVSMQHVPYRGSAPLVTDLLSGQVQSAFDNLPASIEHQVWQAARTRGRHCDALGSAPERADTGRIPAGFRGQRICCNRRAQEHADRDHRLAQPRDQRRPRRSQDQGAARRARRHGVRGLARRFQQAHRRRNREVGAR